MTGLFNIALMNAVTVIPLAIVAMLASRTFRRPALTHAIWVLVLIKFVTPPLFQSPFAVELPVLDQTANKQTIDDQADTRVMKLKTSDSAEVLRIPDLAGSSNQDSTITTTVAPPLTKGTESHDINLPESKSTTSAVGPSTGSMFQFRMRSWTWRTNLLFVWMSGTVFWGMMQIARAIRFHRQVVRGSSTNDELQFQCNALAPTIGLARAPQVLLVDAVISPMLWGCGRRAKLLFPLLLAERLEDSSRATLLAHELAHYRRGDHWVRLLELVSTTLFWWHPVVWWAKRQIEEAEEECCDAWVVCRFPEAPRQYAEALLDTIDFLCESRRALPPVACGLGQAHFIRHRLTRIMNGSSAQTLSQRMRCAVLLAAVLLLPLQTIVFGASRLSHFQDVGKRIGASQGISTPLKTEDQSSTGEARSINETNPDEGHLQDEPKPPQESTGQTPQPQQSRRVKSIRGEKTWSTAASSDGRFVIRTTTARRVALTDLSSNNEVDLSDERITAVAFAPERRWFASAGSDGRVAVWDSGSGRLLRTLVTHSKPLRTVAVSPDGGIVAAGGPDGSLILIDVDSDEPSVTQNAFSTAINCVRFSNDGNTIAVASGDWMSNARGEIVLLNRTNGRAEATLPCASAPGAVTFASNEELIVGLWDGTTQLWNLPHRQIVGSAQAAKNVVSMAAFSPDNPALREVVFVATVPTPAEEPSPLTFLRDLLSAPAK